jgi:hypothetical protein
MCNLVFGIIWLTRIRCILQRRQALAFLVSPVSCRSRRSWNGPRRFDLVNVLCSVFLLLAEGLGVCGVSIPSPVVVFGLCVPWVLTWEVMSWPKDGMLLGMNVEESVVSDGEAKASS